MRLNNKNFWPRINSLYWFLCVGHSPPRPLREESAGDSTTLFMISLLPSCPYRNPGVSGGRAPGASACEEADDQTCRPNRRMRYFTLFSLAGGRNPGPPAAKIGAATKRWSCPLPHREERYQEPPARHFGFDMTREIILPTLLNQARAGSTPQMLGAL